MQNQFGVGISVNAEEYSSGISSRYDHLEFCEFLNIPYTINGLVISPWISPVLPLLAQYFLKSQHRYSCGHVHPYYHDGIKGTKLNSGCMCQTMHSECS